MIRCHFCHEIAAPNAVVECCVVWRQHICLVGRSFGFRVPGEEAIALGIREVTASGLGSDTFKPKVLMGFP
jgi:hypothetical protein